MDICPWAATHPLHKAYHDTEWGVPVRDEQKLFEMITLEGAQAGLSWLTVLKKREGYRKAFFDWDIDRIAVMTENEQAKAKENGDIIRNRLKIASTVTNAQATIRIRKSHGGLSKLLWSYVDDKPITNKWQDQSAVPTSTAVSDQISEDLKKLGFKFVGTTIVYAYLQAVGIVNDHLTTCHRWKAVQQSR